MTMTHKTTTPHPRRHKLKKQKPVPKVTPVATDASTAQGPTKTDAYKLAIEITASAFDARKIVIALAKEHPELLVRLYRATTVTETWQRDIVTAVYQGNPVHAIKLTRENTGLGLKEAKDVVDNLRRLHVEERIHDVCSVPHHTEPRSVGSQ